jgi:hypothetical protein
MHLHGSSALYAIKPQGIELLGDAGAENVERLVLPSDTLDAGIKILASLRKRNKERRKDELKHCARLIL